MVVGGVAGAGAAGAVSVAGGVVGAVSVAGGVAGAAGAAGAVSVAGGVTGAAGGVAGSAGAVVLGAGVVAVSVSAPPPKTKKAPAGLRCPRLRHSTWSAALHSDAGQCGDRDVGPWYFLLDGPPTAERLAASSFFHLSFGQSVCGSLTERCRQPHRSSDRRSRAGC